jgi:mannuronan synthase
MSDPFSQIPAAPAAPLLLQQAAPAMPPRATAPMAGQIAGQMAGQMSGPAPGPLNLQQVHPAPPGGAPAADVPADFVYDSEHPVLTIPFSAQFGDTRLTGTGISAAAAYVAIAGQLDPRWAGRRGQARLSFDFDGFSVVIPADMVVAGSRRPGEMTLQFANPLGPHLPQLRHLLNSHIAGDMVTIGGFLSYTGPTKPKAARMNEAGGWGIRIRSLGVALLSIALITIAVGLLVVRANQQVELRPIFVDREGREMRATTAGQISYLNPAAQPGEVLFSINSNTGDVLNFQLPCACEVRVTDGVFEGATVLPEDVILSIFESNVGVRVETQISIEGLARVMNGDSATLELSDGRALPVTVNVTSATNLAAARGEVYVPVTLDVPQGALATADIGISGRLRLTSAWLANLLPNLGGALP